MNVLMIDTVKDGGSRYVEGKVYDVPESTAAYFVQNGWALDPAGRVVLDESVELPTHHVLTPDSGRFDLTGTFAGNITQKEGNDGDR